MAELTPHQNQILEEAITILQKSDRLVIRGSAGVGKTFLVNELIKKAPLFVRAGTYIYCTAPTNKAVNVIKSKVDSSARTMFLTTHAALKVKRKIDNSTGEVSFVSSFTAKTKPLDQVGLLIVDEASMLNKNLLEILEEHATLRRVKVVFLGDTKQLNPVNEEESPVFVTSELNIGGEKAEITYPYVELTEIIRQGKGSPIIDLSRDTSVLRNKQANYDAEVGGYIFVNSLDKIVEKLAEANGTDKLKYLAYTNAEVDKVNKLVREKIYTNPAKIEEGEILTFDEPYKDIYSTNEEIEVSRVRVIEREIPYLVNKNGNMNKPGEEVYDPMFGYEKIKLYSINFATNKADGIFNLEDSIIDNILVIHEESEKTFAQIVDLMKRKAKARSIQWQDYFQFIEQFANMKYNHAITVHKSQGSTYDSAVINHKNLNSCINKKEKERLLYTAITRASKLVIMYNT